MAERVAAIAEETIPELAGYYYTADSGQSASLVLNLTDKGERDRSATDIANACATRPMTLPAARSPARPTTWAR